MASEAAGYARSYGGSFPFMCRMRALAQNPSWLPTQRQAVAILKCRSNEARKPVRAKKQPMRRR